MCRRSVPIRIRPVHRFATRHPGVTLALCLLALAVGWLWIWPPAFNSSAWVLMQSDQRQFSTYRDLRESLQGREIIGVVIDHVDVFSDDGAKRIDQITKAIKAIEGMGVVTSLTTKDRPLREGMKLTRVPFIPTDGATDEQWEQIEVSVTGHLIARNIMVSSRGDAAMVLAVSSRDLTTESARTQLREDLLAAIAPFDDVYLVAYAVIDGEVREAARTDALRFVPAAIAVIVLVLLLTFRRPGLVFAMLANQIIVLLALPVLLSIYAWLATLMLGREVPHGFDLYTSMLLPLTAAIHLALQVHVVSACLLEDGPDVLRRIDGGVGRVTRPTLVAAATTVAGLISLGFSEVTPVVRFAIVGAVAVALAAVYTLGPGMALIALALRREDGSTRSALHGNPQKASTVPCHVALSRWGLVVTIVLVAFLPGIASIRTDVRAIEMLNEQSMTRQAAERIDAKFGGATLFMIDFKFEPDPDQPNAAPINNLKFLRFLADKRKQVAAIAGVGDAYDYSQAFSLINRIWHGDDPAYDRLPDSPLANRFIGGLLQNFELPFIEKLRSTDGHTALILIRTAAMPSRDYLAILERVMDVVKKDVPPGVTVQPKTGLHNVLKQDRQLVADQAVSAVFTLLAVAILVGFVWRSWKMSAAVTFVSALPVLAMLGLAGYTDTSINSITMMTASVVLGLVVDDSAHLLDATSRRRRQGMSWPQAIVEALAAKRRPIICTSLILASVLGLFTLSSFPPVRAFGWLACAALLAALAAVLLLLPALMLFGGRVSCKKSDGPGA